MWMESRQPQYLDRIPKRLHIPVVALTAWIAELWREKALRVGIVTYLLKPVSPQTLNETINQYANGSLPRNTVISEI